MEVLLPSDINRKNNTIFALSTRKGALPLKTAVEKTAESPSEVLVLKVPLLAADPSLRRELRIDGNEIGSTFDGTPITNLYMPPSDPIRRTMTEQVTLWRKMRREEENPVPEDLTVLIPHLTPDLVIAALHATGILPDGYAYKDLFIDQGTQRHPLVDLLLFAMRRTKNMRLLSQCVSFYLTRRMPLPAQLKESPSQEALFLEQ